MEWFNLINLMLDSPIPSRAKLLQHHRRKHLQTVNSNFLGKGSMCQVQKAIIFHKKLYEDMWW